MILRYRRDMVVDKETLQPPRDEAEPLRPFETTIRQEIWNAASGTSGEITTALDRKRERQLSPKTILTCLPGLEAKGLVVHHQEGHGYRCWPVMDEGETAACYIGNRLSEIIGRYDDLAVAVSVQRFCGDPVPLAAGLSITGGA
jgi:predicted transcriptional regulator